MTSLYSNTLLGQKDDYRFSFTMTTGSGTSVALVKKISIQFPPYSTNDYSFAGT